MAKIVGLLFVLAGLTYGQVGPDEASRMPVQRVVLYKSGVGYFEHVGSVRGNEQVGVSFTPGQLDDVLKSLTVLDLNGGRIAGVEYGSTAPASRQLGDLQFPVTEKSSLTEILGGLRGARLEVRSGTTVLSGRLLSIERKTRISGGTTLEVDYLSLVTDTGDLRTTELTPAFSVRLLEPELAAKMGRYLDIVSRSREADTRRMVISAEGSGDRKLFVSYIAEVPVWKTTYRVVLGSKNGQKPLLQGWAIVDNTTAQDWRNVQLSLVAGAPQTFVQNLSQPYYLRRPVVPLPQSVSRAPQTYESTLLAEGVRLAGRITDAVGGAIAGAWVKAYTASGTLASQAQSNAQGEYRFESLTEGSYRLDVEANGFGPAQVSNVSVSAAGTARRDVRLDVGSVAQSVSVGALPTPIQTSNSQSVQVRGLGSGSALGGSRSYLMASPPPPPPPAVPAGTARASMEAAAVAQDLGDLFEYKLKQPITIQKNRSALVPVVQAAIDAEKVSVWNDQMRSNRPLRALWLTNSSELTLDGGSFSVLEDETFEGEGIVEPIRAGEKRLVSYATDLAVNASSRNTTEQERVTRVRVSGGVMIQERELRERKMYTFRNEDAAARTVIVEHPARTGYQLRSDVKPVESSAGWMRFRVRVEPKQTATLLVDEGRGLESTFGISNIGRDELALFVRQRSIDAALEQALGRIMAQRDTVADLVSERDALETEAEKIYDDQQRLRENLKALKGTVEEKALTQRYVQQLSQQEDRLEKLHKEQEAAGKRVDAAQEVLARLIRELSADVKL